MRQRILLIQLLVVGCLFGNSCPVSSRWHSLRRSKLWQVEKLSSRNKYDLFKQRLDRGEACNLSIATAMASEYMPKLKRLNLNYIDKSPSPILGWQCLAFGKVSGVNESSVMSIDEDESLESKDDIEDW